jgi:hypothetical protein
MRQVRRKDFFMTLEELKKAMEDAKKASLAKVDDKVLAKAAAEAEKAYDDAKAEADELEAKAKKAKEKSEPDDEFDEEKADAKTKAYIKKLRDEAAAGRVKNKELNSKFKTSEEQKKAILKAAGIDPDDDVKPEDKIKNLQTETQNLAFKQAVLELAVEHGIAKKDLKYFTFLINEAASELGDGEELSEEKTKEIVAEIKTKASGNGNTSVNGKGKKPIENDPSEITLNKFCKMGMVEKSELYTKNKDLYMQLAEEAKAANRLI